MSVSPIKQLRKVVDSQKKKHKITASFSYRFDNKTDKLILNYSLPTQIRKKGKIRKSQIRKQKYRSNVNTSNWKKFFDGDRSIVIDDAKFVDTEIGRYRKGNLNLDENDFNWWIENYCTRKVGQTKTLKQLSPLTTKQNRNHLTQYYIWCRDYDIQCEDINTHIDNAVLWFEQYYQSKLENKEWSPTTIHTAYRNIRGFYNYVADRSKSNFPYNILKKLKIPEARNERDKLNSEEFNKVLDFISLNKKDTRWSKFILMMTLQMKTGMRVSELCNIRKRNIDKKLKQIKIVGKGDKIRKLNFVDKADKDLWNSILQQYDKSGNNGLYLFYRTRVMEYPLKKKTVELDVDITLPTTSSYYLQRFREMRNELGLRKIITSHSIRRYFITEFAKSNSKELLKQIIGHSSDRMVNYYVGDMIEETTTTTIDIGI